MKVFTLGKHGYVSRELAEAVGISTESNHRQARVLVAARSKAEAFSLLADRGLAPSSVSDSEFRQALGTDVDLFDFMGLLDAPAVFVLAPRVLSPVVRVEAGGSFTVLGRIEREGDGTMAPLRFVPTAAGVAGPAWTEAMTLRQIADIVGRGSRQSMDVVRDAVSEAVMVIAGDPRKWDVRTERVAPEAVAELIALAEAGLEQERLREDELIERCGANAKRVKELNDALAAARAERLELAHVAARTGFVGPAAEALGVTPGRVYQLSDQFLVDQANARRAAQGGAARFQPTAG